MDSHSHLKQTLLLFYHFTTFNSGYDMKPKYELTGGFWYRTSIIYYIVSESYSLHAWHRLVLQLYGAKRLFSIIYILKPKPRSIGVYFCDPSGNCPNSRRGSSAPTIHRRIFLTTKNLFRNRQWNVRIKWWNLLKLLYLQVLKSSMWKRFTSRA